RDILSDLTREFEVLEVVEVSWTPSEFGRNLTRFYGEALPSGSEKEEHCGTGPFLVVVVRDRQPRLELRRLGRGARVIDARVLAAKERYRAWTGGGHRVHATLDPHEFAHDLFLLFGRLPSRYDETRSWKGGAGSWRHDLMGARGWASLEELLAALESTLGRLALVEPADESSGRV